ncbi:MAG: hypothetical protein ACHP7H_07670 [Hyphomicrobiales bacterium]
MSEPGANATGASIASRAGSPRGSTWSLDTAAPLYDTADPRYAWLNKIQAVAKGVVTPDLRRLDYEIFELR